MAFEVIETFAPVIDSIMSIYRHLAVQLWQQKPQWDCNSLIQNFQCLLYAACSALRRFEPTPLIGFNTTDLAVDRKFLIVSFTLT